MPGSGLNANFTETVASSRGAAPVAVHQLTNMPSDT